MTARKRETRRAIRARIRRDCSTGRADLAEIDRRVPGHFDKIADVVFHAQRHRWPRSMR